MAIAPIQLPQNQMNPLEGIIQGRQAITHIFDQAIQAGRDMANRQQQQDAALVQNMQLAQGLAQRRAQDLDQRLIDRRNFDYRAEQDALNLDLRREQLAGQQEDRAFRQNEAMFNRDLRERQFRLAQNADARAQQALDLRLEEERRNRRFLQDASTVDPLSNEPNPTPENTPMPPEISPPVTVGESIGQGVASVVADTLNQTPPTPAQPTLADLLDQQAQYKTAVAAATQNKDTARLRAAQRGLAETEAALAKAKVKNKPVTESELRAREDQEFQREDRAAKQISKQNEIDIADMEAFPLPDTEAKKNLIAKQNRTKNKLSEEAAMLELTDAERAAIKEGEMLSGKASDRLSRELLAVQNYATEAAYVAAGGNNLSEAAKARRAEFYRRNKGVSTATPNTPTAPTIDLNF